MMMNHRVQITSLYHRKLCIYSQIHYVKLNDLWTSSQNGVIGRFASPPCTTIQKITTNLKTKTTQNCWKIELYESPTTNNLKTYSSRRVGGVQMGRMGREDMGGSGEAVVTRWWQWRLVEQVVPH